MEMSFLLPILRSLDQDQIRWAVTSSFSRLCGTCHIQSNKLSHAEGQMQLGACFFLWAEVEEGIGGTGPRSRANDRGGMR